MCFWRLVEWVFGSVSEAGDESEDECEDEIEEEEEDSSCSPSDAGSEIEEVEYMSANEWKWDDSRSHYEVGEDEELLATVQEYREGDGYESSNSESEKKQSLAEKEYMGIDEDVVLPQDLEEEPYEDRGGGIEGTDGLV